MGLTLPEDIEPFCDSTDDFSRAGAYALILTRPDDFRAAWDREFDRVPSWLDAARTARELCYVGGATDILSRLEDHKRGDVRTTALTRVCDIDRLHTVHFATDESYKQTEFRLANWLSEERPRWYVHQR